MAGEFAKLRSALHTALNRIGHRNSHACPSTTSNADPAMHELFAAHEGWAHFDKRRKAAIKACTEIAGDAECEKVAPGTEQAVLDGDLYSLVIKKNNASMRVDKTLIGSALRKKGFSEEEVARFLISIMVDTKPATSVRAVPKG